jgi:glycosyltransferase involved in cell wall biosynthesis
MGNLKSFNGIKSVRGRIAIIHNAIAPYRHPLFEELSKTVDLMVYFCSKWVHPCKWDLWPKGYIYPHKFLPNIPIRTPIESFNFNPTILVELVKRKPNILIINGYTDPTAWLAFVLAYLLRIPVIQWTEGVREPKSITGFTTRPLRLFFAKKPDAIIVPGKISRNYLISLGAKEEKVFIAPNAIDNELFAHLLNMSKSKRKELKSQKDLEGKIVILYVGQLVSRKGIEYLIKAYSKIEKEYANVALLVLGKGPLEYNLKRLASSLGIQHVKVISPGLQLNDLVGLYNLGDIFVLPTLEDVWGFVINEAMACGLPVVATRAAQASLEMISPGESGFIVKEADAEELYKAIKKLVIDCEMRAKMARKSKEIVQTNFSVGCMAKGFLRAADYAASVS